MKKIALIIIAVLFLAGFSGCENGEGTDDYGFAYIYMPQATGSGGLNNNYYVPSGDSTYTYNFKIDADKNELQILLGVLRSGDLSNAAYSVDIIARTDTTAQIISDGLVENGMIFPASLYSLPQKVEVAANESGAGFYMAVPVEALKNDSYTDKKLVLTVGLANPSRFELSATNTNTVVILDVNAIRAHLP
ncbi:MAG: hypothetical protein FWF53_12630 [Candidatus Azobacteroides sp.]|nr:hypothetical protein [Candidatus Azobacteroides sp.]